MINIAVLMACHNRKNKTLHCLQNLYRQEGLNEFYSMQVYLVDDASADGTGEAVKIFYPEVKVIEGNGQLFWNRGMHTAWKAAAAGTYDHFLWVNDDTNLYAGAVKEMLEGAIKTGSTAIICGSIESSLNKGKIIYGGGNMSGRFVVLNYPDGSLQQADKINGNCVLVPKHVYGILGNLDWAFTHAMGDNDYSLRAKKRGVACYTTGHFVGNCEEHLSLPRWCQPAVPFAGRLKNLYSPLSYSHPHEFFIFEKRHFGLIIALKHYCTMHVRVLFPKLWKSRI